MKRPSVLLAFWATYALSLLALVVLLWPTTSHASELPEVRPGMVCVLPVADSHGGPDYTPERVTVQALAIVPMTGRPGAWVSMDQRAKTWRLVHLVDLVGCQP